MSALREVLEKRANSGHGVLTHTELREILAAFPEPEPQYEWGAGPDEFNTTITPYVTEATARRVVEQRFFYDVTSHVYRRTVGPWERVE